MKYESLTAVFRHKKRPIRATGHRPKPGDRIVTVTVSGWAGVYEYGFHDVCFGTSVIGRAANAYVRQHGDSLEE